MSYIYAIIAALGLPLLESFFSALCGFKLLFLVLLLLYKRIDWRLLLIISVIASLVLDVVSHYVLGTNLIIISILFIVFILVSIVVPSENTLAGYIVKFVVILLYYLAVTTVPELVSSGNLGLITWKMVGGIAIKSVVSVLVCLAFDMFWTRIRSKDEGNKIRML